MNPTQVDLELHAISLQIANVYHRIANLEGSIDRQTEDALDDLIIAYRSIRRHINKDENGKRFGASEAYEFMRGIGRF